MSNIYHDLIIDHYQHPRNFGELKNPDAVVQEANASCGDLIEFQVRVKRSANREQRTEIGEIAWRGVGCAISTAGASLLSERVKQIRRISQISQISQAGMVELLGGDISHARIKCAILPLVALQKAIRNVAI
ncbi:iron-sulfur cluster assembly scaffold protein [Candidatus Collierbacteria bacterium]|nr:iron-sulfur cluster assembly scaffold protein [Candidatus Collierbacteria bacterium]